MHPRDAHRMFMLVAIAAVALLILCAPAKPATLKPHCTIGPFETCLKKASNATLARNGVSNRVTRVRCNKADTRCELTLDHGAFCITAHVHIVPGGWNASTSTNHLCRGSA